MVEKSRTSSLRKLFPVVFNGQTTPEAYHVSFIPPFSALSWQGCDKYIWQGHRWMTELLRMRTNTPFFLVSLAVSVFRKGFGNFVILIDDICTVNQSFRQKTASFIWGPTNRFQLAMGEISWDQKIIIENV